MGFLKKLFGGKKEPAQYVDKRGVYFHVLCANCGTVTRLRADKEYDLVREGNGFVWHKTIVDNRCFRPMPAIVHLNGQYDVISEEISGGSFVSEQVYNAFLQALKSEESDNDTVSDKIGDEEE
jgi:hypothetical protein